VDLGGDVGPGGLVQAEQLPAALLHTDEDLGGGDDRPVVDQGADRLALNSGAVDDLAALDNVMGAAQDLRQLQLEGVEAVQLELADGVCGLAAGPVEAAFDVPVGGGRRHVHLAADVPVAEASPAQIQGAGVAVGGVDPGGGRAGHVSPLGRPRAHRAGGAWAGCSACRLRCR
jgi:hypothetical protein